jgi:hypothetical protein
LIAIQMRENKNIGSFKNNQRGSKNEMHFVLDFY